MLSLHYADSETIVISWRKIISFSYPSPIISITDNNNNCVKFNSSSKFGMSLINSSSHNLEKTNSTKIHFLLYKNLFFTLQKSIFYSTKIHFLLIFINLRQTFDGDFIRRNIYPKVGTFFPQIVLELTRVEVQPERL